MAGKKRNATYLSNKLENQLLELEKTRKRMDRLFDNRIIFRRDIDFVYEGIFLKAVTSFEYYLETLFVGTLYNSYKFPTRKKIAKLKLTDRLTANDIVLNGSSYIDWLPYDKVEKRSKIFFNNNPFTNLTPTEKGLLTQIMSIRNAIAHKSPYAEEKFTKQVVSTTYGLPDSNKTPAGFLRFVYRRGPDQTKFENYIYEISGIAHKIANFS